MSDFSTIGIVILAAGASTRLGTPKQLLQYRGRSLLRHTAEVALSAKRSSKGTVSGCQPIVVLGAQSERIEAEVQQLPVTIIRNSRWAEGMSSSIQSGLRTLQSIDPTIEAVIILLCDQPFVSVSLVHQLIEEYDRAGKLIVASEYADTLGVPALFSHALFPELMTLQADRGARFVIQNHVQAVARVPFPLGAVDIDTPGDYEQLLHAIAEKY